MRLTKQNKKITIRRKKKPLNNTMTQRNNTPVIHPRFANPMKKKTTTTTATRGRSSWQTPVCCLVETLIRGGWRRRRINHDRKPTECAKKGRSRGHSSARRNVTVCSLGRWRHTSLYFISPSPMLHTRDTSQSDGEIGRWEEGWGGGHLHPRFNGAEAEIHSLGYLYQAIVSNAVLAVILPWITWYLY